MTETNKLVMAGAAALLSIFALSYFSTGQKKQQQESVTVLIGDVGGTNIRLSLKRLCLKTRTSVDIKPLTKISA